MTVSHVNAGTATWDDDMSEEWTYALVTGSTAVRATGLDTHEKDN